MTVHYSVLLTMARCFPLFHLRKGLYPDGDIASVYECKLCITQYCGHLAIQNSRSLQWCTDAHTDQHCASGFAFTCNSKKVMITKVRKIVRIVLCCLIVVQAIRESAGGCVMPMILERTPEPMQMEWGCKKWLVGNDCAGCG